MSGRPVTDPARMIQGFTVYDLGADGWRAVWKRDPKVVVEYAEWDRVQAHCTGIRLQGSLMRTWGVSGWREALAGDHHTDHHTEAGS